MGYAGGTTEDPTYRNLGDHAEAIRVEYDPARISYEQLLDRFWSGHDPHARPWSSQYRAAVFYHDGEQKRIAERTRDRVAGEGRIHTEILPAGPFHPAEGYHQKYALRGDPALLAEIRAYYPEGDDFVASTAAARLNGYAAGYGGLARLAEELPGLGLSRDAAKRLWETVRRAEERRGNAAAGEISCPVR